MNRFRLKRFDPRAQIFSGILVAGSVIGLHPAQNTERFYYLLLLFFVWILARDQWISLLKDILRIYPVLLLMTIYLPFQKAGVGQIIGRAGPFPLYEEGCRQFAALHVKTFFLLNVSFALARSLSYKQMLALLDYWRTPHWIISIYFYLHRMLQVFTLEAARIKLAVQARNLRLKGAVSFSAFGSFLMMYLLRVFERSERSSQAMLSRGFYGRFPVMVTLHWNLADTFFAGGAFLLTTGFWLWRVL